MSGRVVTQDTGYAAFRARVASLARGPRVRVGILADKPKREPVKGSASKKARVRRKVAKAKYSLLEVAIVHEFGGGHVPARSFIRATVDERKSDILKLQRAVLLRVVDGSLTEAQGLAQIGAAVAAMVQARIVAGIDPPLAPSTIARKKSSKPLIHTGQLRSAITFAVVS